MANANNKVERAPGAKGGGQPRKKNPLSAFGPMLPHLIAIAVGGGCGTLEATQPVWWAKLSDGARVIMFGAAAAVAWKVKQDAASKACETMAAFYLGRIVGVKYLQSQATKTEDKNKAGAQALKGLLAGIDDVVGPEAEAARQRFLQEVDRLQRQDPHAIAGLVEVDDVDLGDVIERIGAGYGLDPADISGLAMEYDTVDYGY